MPTPSSRAPSEPASTVLATVALTAPALLAFSLAPSATFFNQAAAFLGWGAWLTATSSGLPLRVGVATRPALAALLGALGLLSAAALAAPLWSGAPSTMSLSALGLLVAAALVALVAAAIQQAGQGQRAFAAFGLGLVIAGAVSAAIAVLQIYTPSWTGNDWIAAASGRAGANLRQANHLSTLTLWAIVAVIWLGESGVLRRLPAQAAVLLLLTAGVVLTASRTGMLGVLVLAAWGLFDRRLSRPRRMLLLLLPLAYLVLRLLAGVVPALDGSTPTTGEQRFAGGSYLTTSRYVVWADTLALIRAHPWAGVGFGEFNFAWSLTPFADRSGEFFDHTHNLPLQFAVELGLPLAALVLALLLYALLAAFRAAWPKGSDAAPHLRPAFMIVLIVAVHSLLEYPLWYAYFLLPTAFAFGLCLGATPASPSSTPATPASDASPARRTRPLLIAAMLLTIGGIFSVIDYWRVVVIFAPPNNAAPLSQRILDGRRSVFFGHHADYAAATSVHDPSQVMPAFRTATHYLLDTRLMLAWAKAYAARGDLDRARYLAARLREFRNPASEEFFEACKTAPAPGTPAPFQCEPPSRPLSYRDFR